MKCTIDTSSLDAALKGNVARKSTSDIWEKALLECNEDVLSVTTVDPIMQYTVTVPCKTTKQGALAVDPNDIKNALTGLNGDVTLNIKDNKLVLSQKVGGRTRTFKSDFLPAEDFPRFPDIDCKPLALPAETLCDAIRQVRYAAAIKDVRHYLNGIYISEKFVAASDGHRAALCPLDQGPKKAMIVPAPAIDKLLDLLDAEHVAVSTGEQHLSVTGDNCAMHCRLIDGRFPDIERVIPDARKTRIVLPPEQALPVLKRCAKLETHRSASGDTYTVLGLAPGDNVLNVEGQRTQDYIECECTESDARYGINGRYLIDVLTLAADKTVTWHYATPGDAYRLEIDGMHSVHTIMPLRL